MSSEAKINKIQQRQFCLISTPAFFAIPLGNPLYLWYFTTTPRKRSCVFRLGITPEIRETHPLRFSSQTPRPCLARHASPADAWEIISHYVSASLGSQ